MAIYGNLTELAKGTHAVFESSLLKSTISGHLWDCLVVDADRDPIDVDNGVCVKVGAFTHNDNGLQERYATIAGVKDKVGVIGSVPIIKDARSAMEETEPYFYNKAGQDSKVYEVIGDEFDGDVFGVTTEAFTTNSVANIAKDVYVVLDGNGKYVALTTAAPNMSNYGFVAKVHSIATNLNYTLVRLYVVQNVDNN